MKKVLAILVLSLLFTLNIQIVKSETYTGQHGTYKRGIDKRSFCKSELKNKVYTRSQFCVSPSPYFNRGIEVMDGWDSLRLDNRELHPYPRYAIFTNVTKARTKFCGFIPYSCLKKSGDGKLYALARTWLEVEEILDKIDPIRAEEKKERDKEKKIADKKKKEEDKKIAEKEKKTPKAAPNDDKIVPAGSGSGFFVSSNGTVITNHHVIEGCKINKVSHKGSQYEAKVLAVDKVNDIAILKTNITPERVFSVSNEDVSLLEDVVVAGYPLGKQVSSAIKTHKGVVTALAGAGDNYSNFQTDASINQGNSGGPILDQKGNVVGIAVATWVEEGVQGVHFGIKSSTLKTFASANGLKFLPANNRDLSNKDLGTLIIQSTVYVECHMTIASIKKMIAEAENKKAFFKEFE